MRLYLNRIETRFDPSLAVPELNMVVEGDLVSVSTLTNDDRLREIIKKYNKAAQLDVPMDPSIAAVKNGLVYGRLVSYREDGPPARLARFKSHRNDAKRVAAVSIADLTDAWLAETGEQVFTAIKRVEQALASQPAGLPDVDGRCTHFRFAVVWIV